MKSSKPKHDGGRRRCTTCGHPLREHREQGCSVPKCDCLKHTEGADQ